jgi:hypothetical protein
MRTKSSSLLVVYISVRVSVDLQSELAEYSYRQQYCGVVVTSSNVFMHATSFVRISTGKSDIWTYSGFVRSCRVNSGIFENDHVCPLPYSSRTTYCNFTFDVTCFSQTIQVQSTLRTRAYTTELMEVFRPQNLELCAILATYHLYF